MAKVLILGGTGAMGKHLVQILSKSDNKVTVTSRETRLSTGNISYVQGNAHDEGFLVPLLNQKFDVIVDFMAYKTIEFEHRYTLFLNSCSHYIFLSSSRVYAEIKGPIKENSSRLLDVTTDKEFLSTDEYALAKARQEDFLIKSGKNNYTIIRPYITYSENRLQLGVMEKESWLYRALHGRTIIFSKDIANKITTLTYGYNVAESIAALLNNPLSFGNVYHITADDFYQWNDILSIYQDVIVKRTGKRPNVLLLDKSPNLAIPTAQYQVRYDRYYDRYFDNDKIKTFLDTSSFLPMKEGLEKCLNAFIDNPQYNYIDWKAEAFRDRLSGEYASLSEMPTFKQKVKYLIYRFILGDK